MTEPRRDYYEVLGVARDAAARDIKDAFRKLALQYHPDRNKASDAEARFKEIAEAYAVLSDPQKRSEYDARGFAGVSGFSPEDLFANLDFGDLFGGLGFETGGGLFDRLFGRKRPPRGGDLRIDIAVTLERVLKGGEEKLALARSEPCDVCSGSGAKPGTQPRRCASCNGSGQHKHSQRRGSVQLTSITDCEACGGGGSVIDERCPSCAGRGRVERPREIAVRIPRGVEDGMALRLVGQGAAVGSEPPGDLYVIVRTAADPRFARRGSDLWHELSIDVTDAVLGTRIEVPTLEGKAFVDVPAGTQHGHVLRLRSKGLPELDGRTRGHLYLPVSIDIPVSPSTEERDLWQRLKELRAGAARGREATRRGRGSRGG